MINKKMSLELVLLISSYNNTEKDEIKHLQNTIFSVKDIISFWTISGPQKMKNIVENELKNIQVNIPGLYIVIDPILEDDIYINTVLKESKSDCEYQIILKNGQVLFGAKELKKKITNSSVNGFSLLYKNNLKSPIYYQKCCILKRNTNVKFIGSKYSSIQSEEEFIVNYLFGFTEVNGTRSLNMVESKDIFIENNIIEDERNLLLKDYVNNPNNPNVVYHLARLYIGDDNLKSIKLFRKLKKIINKFIPESKLLLQFNREYNFICEYQIACLEYDINNQVDSFQEKMVELQKKFPERIETYYRICCILYEYKNYEYLKNVVNTLLSFPKPNLYVTVLNSKIYDYYIPYIAIDTNIKTGNIKDAVILLQKTLEKYPYDQPLLNIKYELCSRNERIQDNKIIKFDDKVLVIHMGKFNYVWDPRSELKISGSEYMAMNLAREFAKLDYNVFIFGFFEDSDNGIDYQGIYDDVQYLDYKIFPQFSSMYYINYLIISRFTENLVYYENIEKVYLWVHDVTPITGEDNIFFQTHPNKFKGFISLSNWHKEKIISKTGVLENMVIVSRNAIYKERFENFFDKIPYRFIYCSDAYRGLENLIDMIPKIKNLYPQTTLVVYCKIEQISQELMNKIKILDYVSLNPRTDQKTISNELLKSDIWLYPTEFSETYCISALEAMAAGCLVATVKLAGLIDTVGDRGITIESGEKWDKLLDKLIEVMENPKEKERYINIAKNWAFEQTYKNLVKEWEFFFK